MCATFQYLQVGLFLVNAKMESNSTNMKTRMNNMFVEEQNTDGNLQIERSIFKLSEEVRTLHDRVARVEQKLDTLLE
ncbi:hypothetical protein F442_04573 [Phytophthora nicotianae P10297]|uniref:Uncharacterized protein n=1 Tax=Phytophthora nicotianae P10297 TaxID=1317064 RepID=W2ZSK6_PHYNI|nr:hypothetical protein F442_04573 [Phytophthora nicotianae P10297]